MEPIMQPNYSNGDVDSVPNSDDEPVPVIEDNNYTNHILITDDGVFDIVENKEPIQQNVPTSPFPRRSIRIKTVPQRFRCSWTK